MKKIIKWLSAGILAGTLATTTVTSLTARVLANDVVEEIIPENLYGLTEELYFTQEEISSWENEILNQANKERPVGDRKLFHSGQTGFRARKGEWSWRPGVICITDAHLRYKKLHFNHGHAGIIGGDGHIGGVIESNRDTGVICNYEGNWESRFPGNTVYQYGVKRTSVAQDAAAANWAAAQKGKPYNTKFDLIGRRDAFYCSQLVWAAYKDTTGVDIGTWHWGTPIHPFELMHSGETELMFRNK